MSDAAACAEAAKSKRKRRPPEKLIDPLPKLFSRRADYQINRGQVTIEISQDIPIMRIRYYDPVVSRKDKLAKRITQCRVLLVRRVVCV